MSQFRELLDAMAHANGDYMQPKPWTHTPVGDRLSEAVDAVVTYLAADARDSLHDAIDQED